MLKAIPPDHVMPIGPRNFLPDAVVVTYTRNRANVMKIRDIALVIVALVALVNAGFGQNLSDEDLFKILETRDELLFDRAFNKCETGLLETLIADDFEFFHDQAGITPSKKAFIKSISDGICKLTYKPRRELVDESLRVFPMRRDGTLYAAIQTGEHRFFAIEKNKPEILTSTAKFTHLWRLEKGEWRLARVLSYDHRTPDPKSP